jgi:hypothetical protein
LALKEIYRKRLVAHMLPFTPPGDWKEEKRGLNRAVTLRYFMLGEQT